jgi:hypothetical protein
MARQMDYDLDPVEMHCTSTPAERMADALRHRIATRINDGIRTDDVAAVRSALAEHRANFDELNWAALSAERYLEQRRS